MRVGRKTGGGKKDVGGIRSAELSLNWDQFSVSFVRSWFGFGLKIFSQNKLV